MLITVDIGGTKTLIAGFSKDGTEGTQHRFATLKDTTSYITELSHFLTETYDLSEVEGISIAVPGIVKNGVAVICKNLGWENFDIATELRQLVNVPIWVENDANLAGLAEAHSLETPVQKCLYITVSTGIGTGYIFNGAIEPLLSNSEGGRMMLNHNGVVDEWENFASGRVIRDTYNMFARDITDPQIWARIAHNIAQGLLAIIPLTQPEVIVIGGSIGTYFDRYEAALQEELRALPEHIPAPRIIQAKNPEEAVIYGCKIYAETTPPSHS